MAGFGWPPRFGARYLSSAQGRFTSPDRPFADQNPADPQSWNLYSYARNNPLKYIDPSGEAIQLMGETDDERKKELAAIQAALVNSLVAQNLYINPERDKSGKETGRYFVGIRGSVADFENAGNLEANLAEVIGSTQILQFRLGATVSQYDESTPGFLRGIRFMSVKSFSVRDRFGGGATNHGDVTLSGNIETVIDPSGIIDREARAEGIPISNLGEVTAHEIMGHARGFMQGLSRTGTNQMSVDAENAARLRGGAGRGQKRLHHQ